MSRRVISNTRRKSSSLLPGSYTIIVYEYENKYSPNKWYSVDFRDREGAHYVYYGLPDLETVESVTEDFLENKDIKGSFPGFIVVDEGMGHEGALATESKTISLGSKRQFANLDEEAYPVIGHELGHLEDVKKVGWHDYRHIPEREKEISAWRNYLKHKDHFDKNDIKQAKDALKSYDIIPEEDVETWLRKQPEL